MGKVASKSCLTQVLTSELYFSTEKLTVLKWLIVLSCKSVTASIEAANPSTKKSR